MEDIVISANSNTSTPGGMLLTILVCAVVAFLLVQRSRKKKGKAPIRLSRYIRKLFRKEKKSIGRWYGNYEKLITVDAFKKISGKSYVVFDLETTGLDADLDRIIEIGAVRVSRGRLSNETFQQLVNPGCRIPAEASNANHITNEMVDGMPNIRPVLADFLAFVNGDLLVAHNGGFDACFLDNACSRCGYQAPSKYFDTMRLSVYWAGLKNRKLATMLEVAGIENEQAHRALSDAVATAKLCIKSMEKIK